MIPVQTRKFAVPDM